MGGVCFQVCLLRFNLICVQPLLNNCVVSSELFSGAVTNLVVISAVVHASNVLCASLSFSLNLAHSLALFLFYICSLRLSTPVDS